MKRIRLKTMFNKYIKSGFRIYDKKNPDVSITERNKLTGLFAGGLILLSVAGIAADKEDGLTSALKHQGVTFTENKGQVRNQYYQPRPDVLFSGSSGKMVYHLRNNGISYQLGRKTANKNEIYRLDVNWLNVNQIPSVLTDEELPGYENYYLSGTPVLNVKSYKGFTYKNIYNNIDLHYYEKSGDLKYDFIVSPNTDYRQIQLEVKGAEKIELQANGSIILKTPFGSILEGAPIVYQNGKKIHATWLIKNNVLSFNITNYNPAMPLIIDPATRVWGTYYGAGNGQFLGTNGNGCSTDASGNVYFTGLTDASTGTGIATTGSHQSTLSGGSGDGYLVKFNSSGVRQWGTYYGGSGGSTNLLGSACDASGNVYAVGNSSSPNNIATPGSHQPTLLSGTDAILVKFNSAGVRQWGTYYGGSGIDQMFDIQVDATGNLFITGRTTSPNGVATSGAHQTVFGGGSVTDAFLVKFNNSGVLQWGTYYGDSGSDAGLALGLDGTGNVYIAGSTASSVSISTPGSYQPAFAGGTSDAFVAKFNTNGVRQWGTYYGGAGNDAMNGCDVTSGGDVYGFGTTGSAAGIASTGAFQTVFGGGPTGQVKDAFLAKLNTSGTLQWGTYFGGTGAEEGYACVVDLAGNVIVVGQTGSSSGIATLGSHQPIFAGGSASQPYDAFVAKFAGNGSVTWGTYYGGSSRDVASGCAVDAAGTKIYVGGSTQSSGGTAIATTGAHQAAISAANDAFLVQFTDCISPNPPVNTTAASNLTLCSNATTTLSATAAGAVNWYASASSTSILSTGGAFTTPSLSAGTHTYYAETTNTCSASLRTAITVSANPLITVNSGAICAGNSFTLIPAGAISYTFSNGNAVVSPNTTTSYTVAGTDAGGCVGTAISNVIVNPLPVISVNNGGVCLGNSFTLQPSGAVTYTFSGGSAVVSPSATTSYTISGTSSDGCVSASPAVATVTINAVPTLTATSTRTSICKGESTQLSVSGAVNYSWSTGASGPTVTASPTITSTYTVTGTGSNGCSNKATVTQTVKVCQSIDNLNAVQTKVTVFPNPANGIFSVSVSELADNMVLEVYNTIGQVILNVKVEALETRVNISEQAAGVYFVRLSKSKESYSHIKVIKE